jgi:ketosteroid isomerase-like protein
MAEIPESDVDLFTDEALRGPLVTSSAKNQKTTEELVASFMDRLGEGDAEGIGELFADEIDWYVPGSEALPWTGSRGRKDS